MRAGGATVGGRAGRGGVLAALAGLFVEPAQEDQAVTAVAHADDLAVRRPVVAVAGFRRRCGTTTVARALAAELAARDATGAAVATAAALASGGVPLGTAAAGRLGRAVQRALPTRTRVAGRLCLTLSAVGAEAELVGALRGIAPIVLDVDDPACASVAASLADAIVVVAGPATEPALAPVLAGSLARVGPPPIVVLNRARDADAGWDRHAAVALPESRMGAQLALAGREARGELGRAVARLADLVGEAGTR